MSSSAWCLVGLLGKDLCEQVCWFELRSTLAECFSELEAARFHYVDINRALGLNASTEKFNEFWLEMLRELETGTGSRIIHRSMGNDLTYDRLGQCNNDWKAYFEYIVRKHTLKYDMSKGGSVDRGDPLQFMKHLVCSYARIDKRIVHTSLIYDMILYNPFFVKPYLATIKNIYGEQYSE